MCGRSKGLGDPTKKMYPEYFEKTVTQCVELTLRYVMTDVDVLRAR